MDIRQLLKIPEGYKIEKIDFDEDSVHVDISPHKRKLAICSGCGQTHNKGYHGSEVIKVRDMPAGGRKVYLHILKRKYRCPKDGKIYVEHLDWTKKKEDIPLDLLKKFIV
jgi:transposase